MDSLDRRVEKGVWRTHFEPGYELRIGWGLCLDPALKRQAQDDGTLLLGDGALGPGDLDQWSDEECGCGIRRYPNLPRSDQNLRILELQLFGQRDGNIVQRGALAKQLE